MAISYKKLWHVLIDLSIKKTDLQESAHLCWGTIAKLNLGENVSTSVLLRICKAFDCDIADIIEITHEKESDNVCRN